MRVALLAGEASGDQLGAELIKALKQRVPDIEFDGVGGPLMQEQGFTSLLPMDDFSVMGLTEILKSLPKLLRYRRQLTRHYREHKPDAFVGIDYPEFNLSLENRLKKQGVFTAHYVSPSVWAWREERIHHIKESCDLMLTLFNFEKSFYDVHNMPAVACGHPLVDMFTDEVTTGDAQASLGIAKKTYLAVLPGSRMGEVSKMLPVYAEVMQKMHQHSPEIGFLIPAANDRLKSYIDNYIIQSCPALDCQVFLRQGHSIMTAAQAVLLTSGTATLEATLLEKPMLVSYKVSSLTAYFARKRLKVSYFALPNLLAQREIVPEYMQDDIDTTAMATYLCSVLENSAHRASVIDELRSVRDTIKPRAAENAADALVASWREKGLL